MSRFSPWMERAFALVEQGPIRREELILSVMDLVPPGRADRSWQGQIRWTAKDRGYYEASRLSPPGSDRSIRAGQRMLVNQTIWSAIKRGRLIEYKDAEGVRWVRKGREAQQPSTEPAVRAAALMDPQRRHEIRKRAWENMDEATRERVRQGPRNMDPTKRSESTRKGWETRRRRYTPEQIREQNTPRRFRGDSQEAVRSPEHQANERPPVRMVGTESEG